MEKEIRNGIHTNCLAVNCRMRSLLLLGFTLSSKRLVFVVVPLFVCLFLFLFYRITSWNCRKMRPARSSWLYNWPVASLFFGVPVHWPSSWLKFEFIKQQRRQWRRKRHVKKRMGNVLFCENYFFLASSIVGRARRKWTDRSVFEVSLVYTSKFSVTSPLVKEKFWLYILASSPWQVFPWQVFLGSVNGNYDN